MAGPPDPFGVFDGEPLRGFTQLQLHWLRKASRARFSPQNPLEILMLEINGPRPFIIFIRIHKKEYVNPLNRYLVLSIPPKNGIVNQLFGTTIIFFGTFPGSTPWTPFARVRLPHYSCGCCTCGWLSYRVLLWNGTQWRFWICHDLCHSHIIYIYIYIYVSSIHI